jgi:hypothetical protein
VDKQLNESFDNSLEDTGIVIAKPKKKKKSKSKEVKTVN